MCNKIDIIVLCSESEPIFNYNALKLLSDDDEIQIALMVIDAHKESLSVNNIIKYFRKRGFLRGLYKIFSTLLPGYLGYRVELSGTYKSRRLIPISNLEIDCKKIITNNIYSEEVISEVRKMNPTVIARLSGGGIVREPWLSIAKYGILSYHHDDSTKIRGGPPCFWEYYYHDNVQGVAIQKLDEGLDTGPIVMQRFYPINYSATLNEFFDTVMLESSDMMLLSIKNLFRHDFRLTSEHEIGKFYTVPGVLAMIKMLVINTKILLAKYRQRPFWGGSN